MHKMPRAPTELAVGAAAAHTDGQTSFPHNTMMIHRPTAVLPGRRASISGREAARSQALFRLNLAKFLDTPQPVLSGRNSFISRLAVFL